MEKLNRRLRFLEVLGQEFNNSVIGLAVDGWGVDSNDKRSALIAGDGFLSGIRFDEDAHFHITTLF